jgi:hypothetical protein
VTRLVNEDGRPPPGCVRSVVAVTVAVYTPRRDYVDSQIATEDVRAAIDAALAHDFPGVAAVHLTNSVVPQDHPMRAATRQTRRPDQEAVVLGVIIVFLLVWLALSIVGAVIEGLFWLTIVGAVLFLATAAFGAVRRRSAGLGTGDRPQP